MSVFTIAHSNFPAVEFLKHAHGLDAVWDVRSHPTSSLSPQYDRANLEHWLPEAGIEYQWVPGLGGWDVRHAPLAPQFAAHDVDVLAYTHGPKRFPKDRIAKRRKVPEDALVWYVYGLLDYSFFMTLDEFHEAAERLIVESQHRDIGIMCVEATPWRCHRSMVADYLAFRNVESYHIMGLNKLLLHSKMLGNRLDRYAPEILAVWRQHLGTSVKQF